MLVCACESPKTQPSATASAILSDPSIPHADGDRAGGAELPSDTPDFGASRLGSGMTGEAAPVPDAARVDGEAGGAELPSDTPDSGASRLGSEMAGEAASVPDAARVDGEAAGAELPSDTPDCTGQRAGDGSAAARKRALRRVFSRIGFALCAYMLATLAAQLLALRSPALVDWVNGSEWGLYLYSSVPQYLVGAPLLVLLLRPLRREVWPQAGMTASGFLRCLLMCFGLGFAGNLIGQMIQQLFTLLTGLASVNPLETLLGGGALLPQIVLIGIAAPVMEELLFRKLLIDRLHRYGDRVALLVSALLFALLHGNFNQLFYAFGIGLLLGYLYCRTRRLGYTILLHMAVNLFSGVLLPLAVSAIPSAAVVGTLSFALIALYVWGLVLFAGAVKRVTLAPGAEPLSRRDDRLIFGSAGMICYLVLSACMCIYALFPA